MEREQRPSDEQAPWWGIVVLYHMLTPIALLAFLAFKFFRVVWNSIDDSAGAIYALFVFAIGGFLLFAYVVIVVRRIYVEFVVPKLVMHSKRTRG